MRWINEQSEFDRILKDARACALVDIANQQAQLERFTFDCVEFKTKRFLHFLHSLMQWSGDRTTYFIVLDPDPIRYFYPHFHKYPLLEIGSEDSEDDYIAALNADPGTSPADAVGINWSEYVMLPPSKTWFIHTRRDSRSGEGGHLWVPPNLSSRAKEVYPYGLY